MKPKNPFRLHTDVTGIMKIQVVIIMLFLGFTSTAQISVTIGSGLDSNSFVPINANAAYTYSQQIYIQNEINQPGIVNKLRLYVTTPYSSNPTSSSNWVVFMGHTTKTSFTSTSDWIPLIDLTTVFSGNISWPSGGNNWMEITLNNSFTYNNIDNLVIAVDENSAGANSSFIRWGVFNANPSNRVIRYYDATSGTNPNPANPPLGSPTTRASAPNRIQLVITPLCTPPTVSVSGNNNACSGSSATLTANASSVNGAITGYQWSLNGTAIPGATGSTYDPVAGGNYTVVVTDVTGCTAASSSFNLTFNNAPLTSMTGNTTFCSGDSTLLTVNANPGSGTISGYQWQLNGVNIPGATSSTHYATSGGSYSVVVTNSAGCSTTSFALNVSAQPLPSASFGTTINGLNVIFNNTTVNGTTYTWDFGDGSSSVNTSDPTHNFPFDGTYTVSLIANNACGSDTITHQVIIITTGIQEFSSTCLIVYPNPAETFVSIKLELPAAGTCVISVLNLFGQEKFSDVVPSGQLSVERKIAVDQFEAGIYLVKVKMNEMVVRKILIVK